jgi:hypothetical protein
MIPIKRELGFVAGDAAMALRWRALRKICRPRNLVPDLDTCVMRSHTRLWRTHAQCPQSWAGAVPGSGHDNAMSRIAASRNRLRIFRDAGTKCDRTTNH